MCDCGRPGSVIHRWEFCYWAREMAGAPPSQPSRSKTHLHVIFCYTQVEESTWAASLKLIWGTFTIDGNCFRLLIDLLCRPWNVSSFGNKGTEKALERDAIVLSWLCWEEIAWKAEHSIKWINASELGVTRTVFWVIELQFHNSFFSPFPCLLCSIPCLTTSSCLTLLQAFWLILERLILFEFSVQTNVVPCDESFGSERFQSKSPFWRE